MIEGFTWAEELAGRSFAFFGELGAFPSYHGGSPHFVVRFRGAEVRTKVTADLDYLVLGPGRYKGKTAALRRADELIAAGAGLTVLSGPAFNHLLRVDLSGARFAFAGGFDLCPADFEAGQPPSLVRSFGGSVTELSSEMDFFVVGKRRLKGKTAAVRRANKLASEGVTFTMLDEDAFLELVSDQAAPSPRGGLPSVIAALQGSVDRRRLRRALDMLKTESFQLYADVDDEHLVGVVRSQTGAAKWYSSRLTPDGTYNCCSPDLSWCMGLQGQICKHLLVLVLGLVQAGRLPADEAQQWVHAGSARRPSLDVDPLADTILRYKGAQAGEVDWRPTETVPEDFYAF